MVEAAEVVGVRGIGDIRTINMEAACDRNQEQGLATDMMAIARRAQALEDTNVSPIRK